MKKYIIIFLLIFISIQVWAQDANFYDQETEQPQVQYMPQAIIPLASVTDEASNLQIAISNRDYPVTPGDVYTLTFLLQGETVSNTLLVESDYTINMTIFGKLNAEGMRFSELKPIIEQKIADAYPRSLPSVTITSVGVFQIPILGEVPESRFITAWGLSRLSEVVEDNLSNFSSIRDIEIISADDSRKKYDLLLARNHGNLGQNPYVRPNDTIIISRVSREVKVLGEVYRPGNYQIKDNEDVQDLLFFTGGFTPMANTSRIKVDRYTTGKVESFTVNYNSFTDGFEFYHGDIISVPTVTLSQPVIYIEGSVQAQLTEAEQLTGGAAAAEQLGSYNRIVMPLKTGETLYDMLNSIRNRFLPFADLAKSYVLRGDEVTEINVEELLYQYNLESDFPLQPFDRIVVPIKRPEVYVTGAANVPGAYSYNPGENYLYYVNIAGGFDLLRNKNRSAIITDQDGNRRNPHLPVQPGDTINVLTNDFLYNFNQYFPAIVTGLGLITTIVSLTNLLNQTVTETE